MERFITAAADNGNRTAFIVTAVICVVLLIVLVIVGVVLYRKKKAETVGGATLHIEVLSGLCYNADFGFPLSRELTVGTDRDCDLVFEDPAMLPVHAVIACSEGTLTVAACDDSGSVYVGGMKIFSPNRLRSGDIITVGTTSFKVYFDQ